MEKHDLRKKKTKLEIFLNIIMLLILVTGIILYFPLKEQQQKDIQFCKSFLNAPINNLINKYDYLYYRKINNQCCSFDLINNRIERICKQI